MDLALAVETQVQPATTLLMCSGPGRAVHSAQCTALCTVHCAVLYTVHSAVHGAQRCALCTSLCDTGHQAHHRPKSSDSDTTFLGLAKWDILLFPEGKQAMHTAEVSQ